MATPCASNVAHPISTSTFFRRRSICKHVSYVYHMICSSIFQPIQCCTFQCRTQCSVHSLPCSPTVVLCLCRPTGVTNEERRSDNTINMKKEPTVLATGSHFEINLVHLFYQYLSPSYSLRFHLSCFDNCHLY